MKLLMIEVLIFITKTGLEKHYRFGRELKNKGSYNLVSLEEYDSLPLSYLHDHFLTIDVYFERVIIRIGGYMLEDRDFEFPKRESKLDRVRVEWKNLTNDKEKRRYCDELEEVIQDLEDELDRKNKGIDKLDKTRKQLRGYLVVSIIFLLVGWWLFFIT